MIARFHLPQDTDVYSIQRNVTAIARDVKYSKHWQCEFCRPDARETNFQNVSWQHLTPPRLMIYVHFICDIDQPHVRKGLTATQEMLQRTGARSVPQYHTLPKRPAWFPTYPLAGSCAFCERDDGEAQLYRCSTCRMTRYCGRACQRRDWGRHKGVCRMVHFVKFENWG